MAREKKVRTPLKQCPGCRVFISIGFLTCPKCSHVFKDLGEKATQAKKSSGVVTRRKRSRKENLDAVYLGIDPGKLGGAAVVSPNGIPLDTIDFVKSTERGISGFFKEWAKRKGMLAALERVHSMPKQGVKSAFTFGQGYGFLRGLLFAHKIRFIDVGPHKWQQKMGCLSGGDKKVTKGKAEQLFPMIAVTHSIADALLLAWYVRQYWED